MIHAEKSSDDSHELDIKTTGIHSFCIDNSFSSITSKMVYLDLGITRDDNDNKDENHFETVYNVYVSILFCFSCLEFHLMYYQMWLTLPTLLYRNVKLQSDGLFLMPFQ